MGIDDESSHPELCSAVADGVTRNIVSLFREPDAGNPHVRFDEREQETELCQTGLRRALRKQPNSHREAKATAPVLDSTGTLTGCERHGLPCRITEGLSVIWELAKGCPTCNDHFRHADFRY
jgi:hypothetical protein